MTLLVKYCLKDTRTQVWICSTHVNQGMVTHSCNASIQGGDGIPGTCSLGSLSRWSESYEVGERPSSKKKKAAYRLNGRSPVNG